jgi:hypothetical protein
MRSLTPPSGGDKHSPVDGCGWEVFVVLCFMTGVDAAEALTDAAAELFRIIVIRRLSRGT